MKLKTQLKFFNYKKIKSRQKPNKENGAHVYISSLVELSRQCVY